MITICTQIGWPDGEIILSSPIGLTPCGAIGCTIYMTIQWPAGGTVGGPIGIGPYISDSGCVQQRKCTLSTYLEGYSKVTIQSLFEYSWFETYPVCL
jgi:hypothetical protein